MVGKFRVSKSWTIGGLIVQPILFLFFLLIGFGAFLSEEQQSTAAWIFTFVYLTIALSSLYSIIDIISGQYIISESSITQKNALRTRTLAFSEISGYSRGAYAFVLQPNVPGKRRIRISTYIGEYERLASWAEKNFTDLNARK